MSSSKPTDAPSVALVTLGCPKNEVDSEEMMGLLAEAGFSLSALPEAADVVVVNTCGFVRAAQRESIAEILAHAARGARVLVAGCLAQRHGEALLREMPEIRGLLGPGRTREIAAAVAAVLAGERPVVLDGFGARDLSRSRRRAGAPHTAYVRIAEGCDHACAFCLIPRLRGPQRSRTPRSILAEMARLGDEGVHEAVLVAQDTTAWGRDLDGRPTFASLLRRLREARGPEWIRVLYTHPAHWSADLVAVFAEGGRLLPYVDLPIQHAADPVLRAMGRGRSSARTRALIARLRARVPGLILRTTVMTGHPGEGEAEFAALLAFLGEFPFDRLGVFAYSPEAETPAARLPRPSRREALRRRAEVLRRQRDVARARARARVGEVTRVLVEAYDARRNLWLGRSYGEAPEIDGWVRIRPPRGVCGAEAELGEFVTARITGAGAYDLDAALCEARGARG